MSDDVETLIGGPCDGLETAKTDNPILYAGRFGDGRINVYVRRADGRLQYYHTEVARRLDWITTSSANTETM